MVKGFELKILQCPVRCCSSPPFCFHLPKVAPPPTRNFWPTFFYTTLLLYIKFYVYFQVHHFPTSVRVRFQIWRIFFLPPSDRPQTTATIPPLSLPSLLFFCPAAKRWVVVVVSAAVIDIVVVVGECYFVWPWPWQYWFVNVASLWQSLNIVCSCFCRRRRGTFPLGVRGKEGMSGKWHNFVVRTNSIPVYGIRFLRCWLLLWKLALWRHFFSGQKEKVFTRILFFVIWGFSSKS